MRLRTMRAPLLAVLAVAALGACSATSDRASPSEAVSTSPGVRSPVRYDALAGDIAPLAEPLGWEVQRAYRQGAFLVGRTVDLVNVYLRPAGVDPSPAQYLDDALVVLHTIASDVFARNSAVTAIDVCLQRPNTEPPEVEVEPAIRILALREDLEPLLVDDVRLADLVRLSRAGRLALLADPYVKAAPGWAAAFATGTTGAGG